MWYGTALKRKALTLTSWMLCLVRATKPSSCLTRERKEVWPCSFSLRLEARDQTFSGIMKIHHCQGLVSTEARSVRLNLKDVSTAIEEENWRIWIMTTVRSTWWKEEKKKRKKTSITAGEQRRSGKNPTAQPIFCHPQVENAASEVNDLWVAGTRLTGWHQPVTGCLRLDGLLWHCADPSQSWMDSELWPPQFPAVTSAGPLQSQHISAESLMVTCRVTLSAGVRRGSHGQVQPVNKAQGPHQQHCLLVSSRVFTVIKWTNTSRQTGIHNDTGFSDLLQVKLWQAGWGKC